MVVSQGNRADNTSGEPLHKYIKYFVGLSQRWLQGFRLESALLVRSRQLPSPPPLLFAACFRVLIGALRLNLAQGPVRTAFTVLLTG